MSAKVNLLQRHLPEVIVREDRLSRIRYRVQQFLDSLWPQVAQDERAILALWLPPRAAKLFLQMPRRDQRHSLNVFYTLRSAGHEHPDLLAAALLHDVGKSLYEGRRLHLWHRVAIVLLEAVAPAWLNKISALGSQPKSLWHPFYIHVRHPELGAALALNAGCSKLTAALIRRHQDPLRAAPVSQEDRLLAALQAADDLN